MFTHLLFICNCAVTDKFSNTHAFWTHFQRPQYALKQLIVLDTYCDIQKWLNCLVKGWWRDVNAASFPCPGRTRRRWCPTTRKSVVHFCAANEGSNFTVRASSVHCLGHTLRALNFAQRWIAIWYCCILLLEVKSASIRLYCLEASHVRCLLLQSCNCNINFPSHLSFRKAKWGIISWKRHADWGVEVWPEYFGALASKWNVS